MVQSRGHAAAEITDFFFFKDTLFHVAAAGCEEVAAGPEQISQKRKKTLQPSYLQVSKLIIDDRPFQIIQTVLGMIFIHLFYCSVGELNQI